MTLRVTLEIVPMGREDKKYSIGYMDISNTKIQEETGLGEYRAHKFSDGSTILIESVDGSLVHDRDDGAWTLVRKTLELKGFSN